MQHGKDRGPSLRASRWSAGTGALTLVALLVFSLAPAADKAPARKNEARKGPAQPRIGARARQAKRPPSARIQTDVKLAARSTAEFRNPPELKDQDFNQLVLSTGTFEHKNAAELGFPSKFELLCYNGQPIGPTIRVRRGTTFHITVKNDLPGADAAKAHAADGMNEQPHDLCTTNLHTHGLHVSPVGISDNIDLAIKPKEQFTFEYTLPANHPAGTFWYHPHRHGSVAYQLANGVAGALIVEGSPRDGIADLEDVPEIAAAAEKILVFQLIHYRVDPPGEKGVARVDATKIYDVAPDARSCPAVAVPNNDPTETGQVTAINGLIVPVMRLAPGEVQRWRMIHAAWDVHRQIYLVDEKEQPVNDLRFYEMALDGLATGTLVAKGNDPNDAKAPTVEIAPGQRCDVLIQAPLLGDSEKERRYFLYQTIDDTEKKRILARVVVGGAPRPMRLPNSRDLAKCQPFAPIRDEELARTDTSELAAKGLSFVATKTNHFTINKKTFLQFKTPVQIRLNTAEQWTVKADAQDHPFHIHVNPFQVVMRKGADGTCTPMNVWRDTLYVKEYESYLIRSRFQDYLGKTVLHCHFLDHEDQGMMMPIEFIPPDQRPRAAGAARGPSLVPASTRVPAVTLTDVDGKLRDLREPRSRTTVLVFFQGLECSHCAEQLANLVREARAKLGVAVEVVAVSSRRIADPARAARDLGTRPGGPFTLLVDQECRAFRAFRCYREGPLHGLFLIDREGMIRASYTGAVPFRDVQEVVDRLRSLLHAEQGASRNSPELIERGRPSAFFTTGAGGMD